MVWERRLKRLWSNPRTKKVIPPLSFIHLHIGCNHAGPVLSNTFSVVTIFKSNFRHTQIYYFNCYCIFQLTDIHSLLNVFLVLCEFSNMKPSDPLVCSPTLQQDLDNISGQHILELLRSAVAVPEEQSPRIIIPTKLSQHDHFLGGPFPWIRVQMLPFRKQCQHT